ncbi:hypothetical protein [Sphingomonas sp. Leaf37]|uniref:hypothetical protein n=1 Tax=Sphingomonas sp. Leaf37 TaxID=2876552 RepID=UPI001E4978D8|nr:hypothetical protein [Sphingomonas sp. Leaf37]
MAIPRDQLQRAVDAGHPDDALVGFPISLVREILRSLPVETIALVQGAQPLKEAA